jgi:HSP20 family protein
MDNIWSRFFGEGTPPTAGLGEWMPALNVSETDGEINVKAELPGLDADDIDVHVSGDLLTLRGEKKEEKKKEEENYYSREIYSGSFQRTVRLPAEVKGDDVEANFKNGVLTVNLPKSEVGKSKKIKIKS